MFQSDQKHLEEIRDAIHEFGVTDESVYTLAYELYEKAVVHPELKPTRTTPRSIIASVVYMAIRMKKAGDITQTDICYKFKVSPMTLRKLYSRLCELLGIDRKSIFMRHAKDG